MGSTDLGHLLHRPITLLPPSISAKVQRQAAVEFSAPVFVALRFGDEITTSRRRTREEGGRPVARWSDEVTEGNRGGDRVVARSDEDGEETTESEDGVVGVG